jgi:hypothetical protein
VPHESIPESKIATLEQADAAVRSVLDMLNEVWGGEENLPEREANPTGFMRLADASSLLERGANKIRFAIRHMRRDAK